MGRELLRVAIWMGFLTDQLWNPRCNNLEARADDLKGIRHRAGGPNLVNLNKRLVYHNGNHWPRTKDKTVLWSPPLCTQEVSLHFSLVTSQIYLF